MNPEAACTKYLSFCFFLLLVTRFRPWRVTVYTLAGLTVGLAQYMYFGSRLILIIAILMLLFTWRRRMTSPRQLAAFAIGLVLAILPLAVFYVSHPDPFVSRARGVFVMNDENARHVLDSDQVSLPDDLLPLLGEQLRRNLSFFVGDGDRSPFYIATVPGLDMLTTILFVLGLGLAITRLPRFQEYTVLVWFGLGVFIGGVLTIDSPSAPRLLIVIPAVVLLVGIILQRGAKLASAYPRWLKALILLAVLAAVAALNIKIYFGDFQQDLPPGNLAADSIAREIRAASESHDVYLLGEPILYAKYGTIQFLAGDEVRDLTNPEEVPVRPGQKLLFIVLPNHSEALADIRQRWPGGQSFTHVNAYDVPLYTTYRVQTR